MAQKKNAPTPSKGTPVKKQAPVSKAAPVKQAAPKAIAPASFFDRPNAQWWILAGLALVTFVSYLPCLSNKLTNWDDLGYIITNPLIKDTSPNAISNIFSPDHPVMGNYHPITILLYYFEYMHSGLDPFLYHLDSILCHILVTLAVYFFVKTLTGRIVAATVAALLFGVHPMHVESVAWAAGRKDLLYGLFFVMALTSYVLYLRNEGSKKIFWYVATLVLFAVSLLCKAVAVTLPITFFLIDYFEKRPLIRKQAQTATAKSGVAGFLETSRLNILLILDKFPHLAMAYYFGTLATHVQQEIGAYGSLDTSFTLLERAALGCYAFCTYLWKAVIPVGMCNFYMYPIKVSDALPQQYFVYPVIVAGLGVATWLYARRNKVILFGIGFFVVNIVLLLQFVPVGGAILSDRYGYIPYLGLFFIAGWYVSEFFAPGKSPATGRTVLAVAGVYCLVLGFLASERCKDWYDSVTLWKDDIAKNPTGPVGYFYLGQEYFTRYEVATTAAEKAALRDSAMENFNQSVRRKPNYESPIICIAEMQRDNGQIEAAKKTYFDARAIGIANKKENESVFLGLGVVYSILRQFDSAEYCFKKAIALKAYLPEGYSNYANYLDIVGKTDSSLAMYAIAIAQDPDKYIPYMNRGRIYLRGGKYDLAIRDFTRALELNDKSADSYYMRGKCFAQKGDRQHATDDLRKAKQLGWSQFEPALLQMTN